ncbi:hypothetical protein PHJA_000727800 [Phtheirospermum japonicum]|uniref:Uncharacterized protein n=1 Tax=Phtheirospermum japonicum TaxID=374723 RepID=A0A830BE25_9LAMI|nr:hypothetical protein PHJA_000727800 [Phtheirospermum japonicum]
MKPLCLAMLRKSYVLSKSLKVEQLSELPKRQRPQSRSTKQDVDGRERYDSLPIVNSNPVTKWSRVGARRRPRRTACLYVVRRATWSSQISVIVDNRCKFFHWFDPHVDELTRESNVTQMCAALQGGVGCLQGAIGTGFTFRNPLLEPDLDCGCLLVWALPVTLPFTLYVIHLPHVNLGFYVPFYCVTSLGLFKPGSVNTTSINFCVDILNIKFLDGVQLRLLRRPARNSAKPISGVSLDAPSTQCEALQGNRHDLCTIRAQPPIPPTPPPRMPNHVFQYSSSSARSLRLLCEQLAEAPVARPKVRLINQMPRRNTSQVPAFLVLGPPPRSADHRVVTRHHHARDQTYLEARL